MTRMSRNAFRHSQVELRQIPFLRLDSVPIFRPDLNDGSRSFFGIGSDLGLTMTILSKPPPLYRSERRKHDLWRACRGTRSAIHKQSWDRLIFCDSNQQRKAPIPKRFLFLNSKKRIIVILSRNSSSRKYIFPSKLGASDDAVSGALIKSVEITLPETGYHTVNTSVHTYCWNSSSVVFIFWEI